MCLLYKKIFPQEGRNEGSEYCNGQEEIRRKSILDFTKLFLGPSASCVSVCVFSKMNLYIFSAYYRRMRKEVRVEK